MKSQAAQNDHQRVERARKKYVESGGEIRHIRQRNQKTLAEFLDGELLDGAQPIAKCWCWR